jgi:hypothetical protein
MSLAVLALVNFINARDIVKVGLREYFPLTNGDTFTYLGRIDQLNTMVKNSPILEYSAGFTPTLGPLGGRDTISLFLGINGSVFPGDTYSDFFLTQRFSFFLITQVLVGITLLITSSYLISSLTFAFSVFGNFFFNSILQQFASGTLGIVYLAVSFYLLCAISGQVSDKLRRLLLILLGILIGNFISASPETFGVAFPLIMLSLVGLLLFQKISTMKSEILFLVLPSIVVSMVTLIDNVQFIRSQFQYSNAIHPGDALASPGMLINALGISTSGPSPFSSMPLIFRILIGLGIFFLAMFMVSSLFLIKECGVQLKIKGQLYVSLIYLMGFTSLYVIFLLRGKGYSLMKVVDYMNFIIPIVFSLSFWIISKRFVYFKVIFLVMLAIFIPSAFIEKEKMFQSYISEIESRSAYTSLVEKTPTNSTTLNPNFIGDQLNLYLYANRNFPGTVIFSFSDSGRFTPIGPK